MIKKILIVTLSLLALCLSGCGKEAEPAQKTNIIMVADISDSMNKTDPAGGETLIVSTFLTAFNMNHSQLTSEEEATLENIFLGVVTYGDEANAVVYDTESDKQSPLCLGNLDDNDYLDLFNSINTVEYNNDKGTNYYAGLKKAYDMCESNPADRNIIYIFTDGELALKNSDDEIVNNDDPVKKKWKTDWEVKCADIFGKEKDRYTINAICINTNKENNNIDTEDFKSIAKDSYTEITKKTEFQKIALDLLKELGNDLNLNLDYNENSFKSEGGIVTFDLDDDYKTITLWITAEEQLGERKEEATTPELLTIKSPKHDEKVKFENQMEFGGFLGFNKCKISVIDSGASLKVIIKNAPKGSWELKISEKSVVNVSLVHYSSIPWTTIIICSIIAIIFIILFLMWLFYIPPIRYRKKPLPGFLTLEKTDNFGNTITLYEEHPIYAIMKKGKFVNKGRLTLGTLLNDKHLKNVIVKYLPDTDVEDARLEIRGKDLGGTHHSIELYSDTTTTYDLNEATRLTITWSC